MKLVINGKETSIPNEVKRVDQLIQHLSIQNPVLIVEVNGHILQKEDHPHKTLQDGDQVELIQFVGGG